MELGWWGVPIAVLGGAIRVSTPFLFVSLGECLTEKSGRINLGLEGILVMGAMSGYGVSYLSGSPWLGVLVAGLTGVALGLLHGTICSLPRVNDIAVGIGLMLLGTGLAFFLGKPFVQPKAPTLPALHLGDWASSPQVQSALQVNVLFIIGVLLAGVVFMNVAVLRLNIQLDQRGRDRARLRADNAQLASELSSAQAAARIQALARKELGVQPALAQETTYVRLKP